MIAFQDESTPYAAGGTGNTAPSRTATYDTDMADLRSRVASLNSTNSGFYRGILMEVQGYAQFNACFDQWQYYYLYLITDSLNTLGFSPSPGAWPIVIDD